jgi:hypothetical protein
MFFFYSIFSLFIWIDSTMTYTTQDTTYGMKIVYIVVNKLIAMNFNFILLKKSTIHKNKTYMNNILHFQCLHDD